MLLLLAALLAAGCTNKTNGARSGSIEGSAVFMGAVVDAPVQLERLENGVVVETMGSTRTDGDGRFAFKPLVADYGIYRARVDLSGLSWAWHGRTGTHPEGLTLSATIPDYGRYADRRLSVNAYTTLTDAIAESLRATAGNDDADESARAGMVAHLGFDPSQTELAEPNPDVSTDPVRLRLLAEAFDILGETLGAASGLSEDVIYPGQVLLGLIDDARGDLPSGRFDGQAIGGPVYLVPGTTLLDPEALRHQLASSVRYLVANDTRWIDATPADVAAITLRLACSPSSLFASCDPDAAVDPTAPFLDAIEPPPGTPLSGVVDITVRAHDPDGTVARVELQLRRDTRRTPVPPLPGESYVFRVDTTAVVGVARLDAEVVVVNGAGLETRREVSWPLPDAATEELRGFAFKGKARNARIRAYDLSEPPLLLGSAVTDETGAFAVPMVGYAGPVLLEVGDDPAADTARPTVHDDEVRGTRRWRSGRTMMALVPAFSDSGPTAAPVVITPFTDLALARARRGETEGAALTAAYEGALTAFAAHLGIEAGAEGLLHTVPSPVNQPTSSFGDAEKLAFALGCFSAQADGLARSALPDAPDAFDALDLLALYHIDLATDSYLDGKSGAATAAITLLEGEVQLPADPLRADFATACGRWQRHPANGMNLDPGTVLGHLEHLTGYTHETLYDPAVAPRPLDEQSPTVRIEVLVPDPDAGGANDGELPDPARVEDGTFDLGQLATVRGRVELIIDATDPSGIASLTAALENGPANAPWVASTEVIDPYHQRLHLRLTSTALPEGQYTLRVEAADPFDNVSRTQHLFAVDRTRPAVSFATPDLNVVGEHIYTNLTVSSPVSVRWSDESVTRVAITLDGLELFGSAGAPGENVGNFSLPLDTTEPGDHSLVVTVTDATGLATTTACTLHVDRTSPSLEIRDARYLDEGELGPDRGPDEVPYRTLGRRGGLVRRWQTSWGADSDNLSVLDVVLSDGDGPEASPPEGITLRVDVCFLEEGDRCQGGLAPERHELTGVGRGIPITAGLVPGPDGTRPLLPFDPIEAPPRPGRFGILLVEVEDLAGNISAINEFLAFDFEVVAPPVALEVVNAVPIGQVPENVMEMTQVQIAEGDLAELLSQRARLLVHRVTVTNPHDIGVNVGIGPPSLYRLSSTVSEVFLGEPLEDFSYLPPECGDGTVVGPIRNDEYIDAESCASVGIPGSNAMIRRCSACIGHAPAALTAPLDAVTSVVDAVRADNGTSLGHSLEAPAFAEWVLRLPAGASVTFTITAGLQITGGAAWQGQPGPDPIGGYQSTVYLDDALRYRRAANGVAAHYESGPAILQVDAATLSAPTTASGQVASYLFDRATAPKPLTPRIRTRVTR